jgi:hypothetical protein
VLVVFLEHPFRTSGPEYRRYHTVSKGRYNRHGFSPPLSGSRHGQQMRQTKAYASGVTASPLNRSGLSQPVDWFTVPRIFTRTVLPPRREPGPS